MRCHYKIFLQNLEFYSEDMENFKSQFFMDDSKETVSHTHNRTDMHVIFTQDLHKF